MCHVKPGNGVAKMAFGGGGFICARVRPFLHVDICRAKVVELVPIVERMAKCQSLYVRYYMKAWPAVWLLQSVVLHAAAAVGHCMALLTITGCLQGFVKW